MTIAEAKAIISEFLRGDNTSAVVTPLIIRESVHSVARRCEPSKLITKSNMNVFRKLYDKELEDGTSAVLYIRKSVLPTSDSELLDVEEELSMAVIYYICSMLSNKSKLEYVRMAEMEINSFIVNQEKFDVDAMFEDDSGSGGSSGGSTGGSGTEDDGMVI